MAAGALAAATPAKLAEAVLLDRWGRRRALTEFTGYRAIVVAFLGIDCPVANLYVPQLAELEKRYRQEGVQFLAVYPHEHESLDAVAAHACDRDLAWPIFKDLDQRLADSLGATRTPEVCLLDAEFRLVYRGRINDQYGVNDRRPTVTRDYLNDALEAVLADQTPVVAQTPADGCLLDRARPAAADPPPTYHTDVAPILAARCQMCHDGQGTAPFRLTNYDEALRWSAMIREVLVERRMPPWQADARFGHFQNDRRMNDVEIATLLAWIAAGHPRGTSAVVPTAATLPDTVEASWTPDLVLDVNRSFTVPAEGAVSYQYFQVPPSVDHPWQRADCWVRAAHVTPKAPGVVHHVMVFVVPPGYEGPPASLEGISVLTIWAPGEPRFVFPEESACRVPAGSRLVVQVHYTPNGQEAEDRPRVELQMAPGRPRQEIAMWTHENRGFRIAPEDPHSLCRFVYLVRDEAHTRLAGLFPHLHVRGKSFRFVAYYPDGQRETLLSVPRYDFNWQTLYWFAEPKLLPVGTRIHAIAHWDNSRNNPANPDPAAEVHYGQQTWDEMMVAGMMFLSPPR